MKTRSFLWALLAAVFALLTAGGCGGSSNDSSSSSDVNAALNGAWRYVSGDIVTTISGDVRQFTVNDFVLYFTEAHIEDDSGSTNYYGFEVLRLGELLAPLIHDKAQALTTRKGEYEWDVTSQHGTFTFAMSGNAAELTGKLNVQGLALDIDITLQKLTQETAQPANINSLLDGTWQLSPEGGGGYAALNGQIIPGRVLSADLTFSGTDVANEKTTVIVDAAMATVAGNFPFAIEETEAEINHIFANVYRLAINDSTKALFVLTGENSAYLIASLVRTTQSHILVNLTK